MKSEIKAALSARFIYVYAFFAFLLLTMFAPVQMLPLVIFRLSFAFFGLCGGLLLAVDFFTKRNMFRTPFCTLLLLFFGVIGLSSLLNMRYGIGGNIKVLVISAIHFFLLAAVDRDTDSKTVQIQIRVLGETLGLVWLVGVLWSLGQFMMQYSFIGHGSDGYLLRVGLLQGRLFGCFTDPNYAALISIVTMAYLLWAMLRPGCKWSLRIYYAVNMVLQLSYVILSGSRTALIILALVSTAVPILFFAFPRWRGKLAVLKIAATAAAILISLPLFFFAADGIKAGLSYLPAMVPAQETRTEAAETEQAPAKADLDRPDTAIGTDPFNGRFHLWKLALGIYSHKPLFGTSPRNYIPVAKDILGPENDPFVTEGNYIHSGFLSLLVCTGAVGAVLMLSWFAVYIFVTLRYLIQNRQNMDEDYRLILLLTVIILVMSIGCLPMMGLFFTNTVIEIIFWSTAGYLICLVSKKDPRLQEKLPLAARWTDRLFGLKRRKKVS